MWRRDPSALLGISARGSDATQTPLKFVGDLTAGDPPVPIPNTAVKPRRADCTARETVWESRSSPDLKMKATCKCVWPFCLRWALERSLAEKRSGFRVAAHTPRKPLKLSLAGADCTEK